jgi:hypothetical protein
MEGMRIITPIIFLFFLITIFALSINAQKCGGGHAGLSTSKAIPKATIEIIAVYGGNFTEFSEQDKALTNQGSLKIPEQIVNRVIKESKLLQIQKDYCGNQLKQTVDKNVTKSRFHFCTSEVDDRYYLLKISAPNYLTTYYVGMYLGGCSISRTLIIPKIKKS